VRKALQHATFFNTKRFPSTVTPKEFLDKYHMGHLSQEEEFAATRTAEDCRGYAATMLRQHPELIRYVLPDEVVGFMAGNRKALLERTKSLTDEANIANLLFPALAPSGAGLVRLLGPAANVAVVNDGRLSGTPYPEIVERYLAARDKVVDGVLPLLSHTAYETCRDASGKAEAEELFNIALLHTYHLFDTFRASRAQGKDRIRVRFIGYIRRPIGSLLATTVKSEWLPYTVRPGNYWHFSKGRQLRYGHVANPLAITALSLDAPASRGSWLTLDDIIGAPPEEHEARIMTQQLLVSLKERERLIIALRFGLSGEELKHWEIGERLGVSGSYVGQVERTALKKLRRAAGRNL
jgi:RNA polymerase sigma factor (sigma-70 family)